MGSWSGSLTHLMPGRKNLAPIVDLPPHARDQDQYCKFQPSSKRKQSHLPAVGPYFQVNRFESFSETKPDRLIETANREMTRMSDRRNEMPNNARLVFRSHRGFHIGYLAFASGTMSSVDTKGFDLAWKVLPWSLKLLVAERVCSARSYSTSG